MNKKNKVGLKQKDKKSEITQYVSNIKNKITSKELWRNRIEAQNCKIELLVKPSEGWYQGWVIAQASEAGHRTRCTKQRQKFQSMRCA